jgi:hypothetical protein
VLRRPPGSSLSRPLAALAACALVLFPSAAPAAGATADVRKDQRWVFDALNVEKAWAAGKGAGVTVALLDTRVQTSLKEIKGRVVDGPDLSGFFYGDLDSPVGEHGTRMASIIVGSGRNGALSGVAPEARLLSIPIMVELTGNMIPPGLGGPDSSIARAIRYAVNHGAHVIVIPNARYGAQRLDSDSVAYALARGVPIVAPVGDDGLSEYARANGTSYWQFPAGYTGVIGVGAVDKTGKAAEFSSDNLSVLVTAPGVDVPAANPGGGYGKVSSTDAAAALVGGVVALIKARHPAIRPELISRALTSTAKGRPGPGYDDKAGFGTVDAAAALDRAATLAAYREGVPVDGEYRFGGGPPEQGPTRPGPDPFRMWAYGVGVGVGLLAFAGGLAVLMRRSERR